MIQVNYPQATYHSFKTLVGYCEFLGMVLRAVSAEDFRLREESKALIKDELKICLLSSVLKCVANQLLGKSSLARISNEKQARVAKECVLRFLIEILKAVNSPSVAQTVLALLFN